MLYVYNDPTVESIDGIRQSWNRLFGNSLKELHDFASSMGLSRRWFMPAGQGPKLGWNAIDHYVLGAQQGAIALKRGAKLSKKRPFPPQEARPPRESEHTSPEIRACEPEVEVGQALPPKTRVIDSEEIFQGAKEVQIRLDGRLYLLRITPKGKLLLKA